MARSDAVIVAGHQTNQRRLCGHSAQKVEVTVAVRSEMGVAAMVAVVRAAAARKMAGEEVATAGMAAVGMATAVADSASTPCTQHIHILHYYATGVAITSLTYVL